MKDTVILIPAYQPDYRLIQTLQTLASQGFALLVVDDGSGEAYDSIFIEAARMARVVRYAVNRGKGGALKQGLRCIEKCFPNAQYIMTADADGQHKPEDILKVAVKLHQKGAFVIGSRAFSGDEPLRSRLGNALTRQVFHFVSGVKLQDTQTGLRGFERSLLSWLLTIHGNRYEYEMNVLLCAARDGISIDEVTIETVYEDNNDGSHFRPIHDSVKIYKEIFRSALTLKFR